MMTYAVHPKGKNDKTPAGASALNNYANYNLVNIT
jgi:hypothetical protein